jgi:hypothetical protein
MDNQKRYEPFAQYAQKEGRPLEDGLLFVYIEQTLCAFCAILGHMEFATSRKMSDAASINAVRPHQPVQTSI